MTLDEAARHEAEAWEKGAALAQLLQSVIAQLQAGRVIHVEVPTMVRALALQFAFAHLNNGLAIEGLEQLVRDALASVPGARLRAGVEAKGPQHPIT